jgi:hypothetical protein
MQKDAISEKSLKKENCKKKICILHSTPPFPALGIQPYAKYQALLDKRHSILTQIIQKNAWQNT